jgi:hypothetical protein
MDHLIVTFMRSYHSGLPAGHDFTPSIIRHLTPVGFANEAHVTGEVALFLNDLMGLANTLSTTA